MGQLSKNWAWNKN